MQATDQMHEKKPFNRLGFWALIATQFQGAFNDNAYRLIIILYTSSLLANTPEEAYITPAATFLFNLPWMLFPAIAGALGDRFSKKRVTVWTKLWELLVMLTGVVAVLLGSIPLLFLTLFMMAMQSAFFSPAKYGILPEILPESKLSWGNGVLGLFTFIAIILGTAAGGALLERFDSQVHYAMLAVALFSFLGLLASFFVTPAPPAAPDRRIPVNPYKGMYKYLKVFFQDRYLLMTLVGISFFWFAGSIVIQNVTELGKALFANPDGGYNDQQVGYLIATMAMGIGIGSMGAGYLSRGKIELGLVLPGLLGLFGTCLMLALPGLGLTALYGLLFALGFFSGFFDIPLAAMMQQRSPDQDKGGMIATLNLVTFTSMMGSALLFGLLFSFLGLGPHIVFLATGLIALAVGVVLVWIEPNLVLRCFLRCFDGTLLRLQVFNRSRLPEKGGALLIANHVSIIGMLVLLMSTDRALYFVVGEDLLKVRWMRLLARGMRLLPVAHKADARAREEAIDVIRKAILDGHVVCINCEERFAPDGAAMPWHEDYRILTEGLDAPIIPACHSRLWETLYIFKHNEIHWRRPYRLRFPVRVRYGEAVPRESTAPAVREAVRSLMVECYTERAYRTDLLHRGFIRRGRRRLKHMAMADVTTGELNYFKALVGSMVFADKLKGILDDQPMVGVLVPPSVGGALTNIALQILGKAPVNLNYTASNETIASCARQCNITQVLTSRKFLDRLPIEVPGEAIFLEDIKESVTKKDRYRALFYALLAPIRLIESHFGSAKRSPDDLCTIIFSSGSEGEPKGIMLSHRNCLTIIEAAVEVFPHDDQTCLVGYLPFFHSFGYTVTLWCPLTLGLRGVYHPNPLEPRIIGSLSQQYGGSIMIGTTSFLQGFIRRCTPEQFQSLDLVIAGAEKLPERVRNAFHEKFGIEPLEGYGTTECAPAVSTNLPDVLSPGFYRRQTKHGTIGQPMPGQQVRVVDPDTGEVLPPETSGLLQVRGPNVMLGYLNQPEKTASVLDEAGWYSTGDIATIDKDGFITLTDRLARFSKIAGEMVPHTKVEETLHGLLGLTEQALAVASVPDNQKGERLVVLHTLSDEDLEALLAALNDSNLPNLWRPRPNAFYRIEEIPVLGTGKMDIKTVKQTALAFDLGE